MPAQEYLLSDIPASPTIPPARPEPQASAALPDARPSRSWMAWVPWGLGAAAVLIALWSVQQGRQDTQEMVRRMQQQETRLIESQSQSKLLQDALRDAQSKLSVMESKVNEAAGQQAQLEKLYRALSNDSIDVALADLESVILLAAQQAAAGGALQGPLIGLQAAEAKLERLADPSLGNLRRALGKDIERIKLMSAQDSAVAAQKLEAISSQIDQLPLLSEPRRSDRPADAATGKGGEPQAGKASEASATAKPPDAGAGKAPDQAAEKGADRATDKAAAKPSGWWSRILDVALGKGKVVGQDWRDLIRVTRVDNPDAALLSPEQAWFVRENLRLRLLNARMAMSSRQESVLKADLERSRLWLATYFDPRDKQVSAAIEQIRQIQGARAGIEPVISFDSLAVVRSLRSAREAKR